jgi:hypothetical protein
VGLCEVMISSQKPNKVLVGGKFIAAMKKWAPSDGEVRWTLVIALGSSNSPLSAEKLFRSAKVGSGLGRPR